MITDLHVKVDIHMAGDADPFAKDTTRIKANFWFNFASAPTQQYSLIRIC
jgi:hypothetical protein